MSDVGPAADGETDVEAPSNYERLSAHLTPDSLAQALLKSWTESEPGQRQTALVNAVQEFMRPKEPAHDESAD